MPPRPDADGTCNFPYEPRLIEPEEAPSHPLSDSTGLSEEEHDDDVWQGEDMPKKWFSWKSLWGFTGPGALMSIAYIDPGNLESDLQAGAQTGYTILWILLWSTIMGYFFQMLSAKLGVATGHHLAELCRKAYPFWSGKLLWIMAEVAIIGADIQEVIGTAIAIQLLSLGHIPLWAGVIITAVDSFLFLFLDRFGVRRLEAFFAALIAIMAVTFGGMLVDARPPIKTIIESLIIPRLPAKDVTVAVGIVGAIVMPHNLYLHSALVQSRDLSGKSNARKQEALCYISIESAGALLVSLFINISIISVFAKGFFGKGIDNIGLANAGHYLGTAFGRPVMYIWALGLLAAGQSSSMTGTYTGQFVMQGYLNLKVSPALRIMISRGVALVPTLLVLFLTSTPNKLDMLNQWLNVLQSVQLIFALIPVITLTASEHVMGKKFVNSQLTTVGASVMAAFVVSINCYLVWAGVVAQIPRRPAALIGVAVSVAAYLIFIAWLIALPYIQNRHNFPREEGLRKEAPLLRNEA